jgi:hypothetical protein
MIKHSPKTLLPADSFYVIIHAHRQFFTTFHAAAFQDRPAISGSHARPETVHAQPAMNSWLISPLWHNLSFRSGIINDNL